MAEDHVATARARTPGVANKGYSQAGASRTKRSMKGFKASSGSPREDIDANQYTLRQRARILAISSPIAKSAIATNRTNIVGLGLRLKCKIDREYLGLSAEEADRWQRRTEADFALWAEDKKGCDATGVNDFYSIQQLVCESWLTSGDVFGAIKRYEVTPEYPYSLRILVVEADRCRTPGAVGYFNTEGTNPDNENKIYDGVEVDSNGAIVAYWICNKYPYEANLTKEDFVRIEAYGQKTQLPNILHVMNSERPDQYRGVSYLAPVIEPLLQLRRYTESELTAADIEASFSAFIKSPAPTEMPFNEVGYGEGADPDYQVSRDPNEYELGPGIINIMEPGEDVVFGDPKRPNSGFGAFMEAVATMVGAALEIPKEILLKAFTASYSASRAALLEAWKAFRMRRSWLISDFCKPVYKIWLSEAVARGRIFAPGFFASERTKQAYLGAEWIGPSQGMLDPTKEIKAEALMNHYGYSTHSESTMKLNGGNWSKNVSELETELKRMQEAGLRKTEETEETTE